MLARLTMKTVRLLDVHIEPATGLSRGQNDDEENSLVVDLDALRALLPQLPGTWRRLTGACDVLAPICATLHETLRGDFDHVARLLSDLESHYDDDLQNVLPVGLLESGIEAEDRDRLGESCKNQRPRRRRRRSSTSTSPIVIPNTHPSTPTIIITLSQPQVRESSCRVPLQDHAFGSLLTVPCHPSFNKFHPPMAIDQPSLPRIDQWRWAEGHWQAVLPTLSEQARIGMFSKPTKTRRKSVRRPIGNMGFAAKRT